MHPPRCETYNLQITSSLLLINLTLPISLFPCLPVYRLPTTVYHHHRLIPLNLNPHLPAITAQLNPAVNIGAQDGASLEPSQRCRVGMPILIAFAHLDHCPLQI